MTRFNFKEYSFWKWLVGNKKTIKELIKVGVPLIISAWITSNPYWTGFGTILGKFILDGVEYFIKE